MTTEDDVLKWRSAARDLIAAVRPLEESLPQQGPPGQAIAEEVQRARKARGLWGLHTPREAGGLGLSWHQCAAVQEEWHRSRLGLWSYQLFAGGEIPPGMDRLGRDVVEACVRGERRIHQLRVSEGSLTFRMAPDGRRVVDGVCPGVPAWKATDLLIVAQGNAGVVCMPGLAGYAVVNRRRTMGSAELVDLVFQGCRVGPDGVLDGIGGAVARWQAMQRLQLAAGAVGAAEYCLEMALEHLRRRVTFGKPLADRQAMQWMVADSARELHASRLLVHRAALQADAGDDPTHAALVAKVVATDAGCAIVDRVIQMYGGYGYCRDLPLEHFWRELRLYRFLEGNNEELADLATGDVLARLDR